MWYSQRALRVLDDAMHEALVTRICASRFHLVPFAHLFVNNVFYFMTHHN